MSNEHRRRRTTSPTREVMSPHLTDYVYGLVVYNGRLDVWTRLGVSADERRDLADLLEREVTALRMEAFRQDGKQKPVIPAQTIGEPAAVAAPARKINDW